MHNFAKRLVRRLDGNQAGFSLMELLVAIGIMAAIAAVTVPLVTKFAGSGEAGAKKAELSNVQTAFDTLIGRAVISGVQSHTGALKTAKNVFTGFPLKSDGSAIQIDGANADLSDYMRLAGAGSNETTYFYCWDSSGKVVQHAVSEAC